MIAWPVGSGASAGYLTITVFTCSDPKYSYDLDRLQFVPQVAS